MLGRLGSCAASAATCASSAASVAASGEATSQQALLLLGQASCLVQDASFLLGEPSCLCFLRESSSLLRLVRLDEHRDTGLHQLQKHSWMLEQWRGSQQDDLHGLLD